MKPFGTKKDYSEREDFIAREQRHIFTNCETTKRVREQKNRRL